MITFMCIIKCRKFKADSWGYIEDGLFILWYSRLLIGALHMLGNYSII